jgi:hypothetical protein
MPGRAQRKRQLVAYLAINYENEVVKNIITLRGEHPCVLIYPQQASINIFSTLNPLWPIYEITLDDSRSLEDLVLQETLGVSFALYKLLNGERIPLTFSLFNLTGDVVKVKSGRVIAAEEGRPSNLANPRRCFLHA